ncbi:Glutamate or tyrosine decarboxylase [Amycolatopsis pretoriensis]|uniref:Glutamate or tyrosine decarboxylase n=1 Tax=Amycolatopsis pretoriensis TaxID=218821 RepID=A0A1H5RI78_9PSEU|nr:Glutamate or tyrosine decarboxylase [Amycolatopsis pretoriensis]
MDVTTASGDLTLDGPAQATAAKLLARFSRSYEKSVAVLPIVPAVDRNVLTELLDEPFPDHGIGVEAFFADVEDRILPNSTAVDHPRFLAYVQGPSNGIGPYAEAIAATLNQNCNFWQLSPAASVIERSVIAWLGGLFGWGAKSGGILTDGGSAATRDSITAALTAHRSGFREHGLQSGERQLVLYTSAEAHRSVDKAAATLGLGLANVRHIPVDDSFRMRADLLETAISADRAAGLAPFCVVATAGTTTSGSIDPLGEVADICERERLWLHVDGAYGALFVLAESTREMFAPVSRADSITLDPHKMLFAPIEAGALLVKDREKLRRAFSFAASYLTVSEDELMLDFMDFGPQLSRSFKALKVWAALRTFGVDSFRVAAQRCLDLAAPAHPHGRIIGLGGNEPGDPDRRVPAYAGAIGRRPRPGPHPTPHRAHGVARPRRPRWTSRNPCLSDEPSHDRLRHRSGGRSLDRNRQHRMTNRDADSADSAVKRRKVPLRVSGRQGVERVRQGVRDALNPRRIGRTYPVASKPFPHVDKGETGATRRLSGRFVERIGSTVQSHPGITTRRTRARLGQLEQSWIPQHHDLGGRGRGTDRRVEIGQSRGQALRDEDFCLLDGGLTAFCPLQDAGRHHVTETRVVTACGHRHQSGRRHQGTDLLADHIGSRSTRARDGRELGPGMPRGPQSRKGRRRSLTYVPVAQLGPYTCGIRITQRDIDTRIRRAATGHSGQCCDRGDRNGQHRRRHPHETSFSELIAQRAAETSPRSMEHNELRSKISSSQPAAPPAKIMKIDI